MSTVNDTDKATAVNLHFLIQGFEDEQEVNIIRNPEKYEYHADLHGGYIGIVADFFEYAEWIEGHMSDYYDDQDFPGVFQYEVVAPLGSWLFNNPDTNLRGFIIHASTTIAAWFANGQAEHQAAMASCRVGGCDGCTTRRVTAQLNSSQPVEEEEKESTMKISDLLSVLHQAHDQYGNVDVVIRGSKETSFVDAQEVRTIKTPKRRAVYIGKATPNRAQE